MKGIREFGRKAAREPGRRNITAHQVEEAGKRRRSGFFGRFWIVILTVVLAAGLLPVPGPCGRVYAQDQPELTAKGAVVYCENTDEIVFAKGKNEKLFPYSITKLMTAMLAVQNAPLDQKVTVSREAASQKDTSMGLKEGEQVTVEQLLYGALILSGNDAAYALGEAVSGTGKMKDFVAMMNETAKNIECRHTHFDNPSGISDRNNYTTAADFLQIARVAYSNPTIRKIAGTKVYHMGPTNKSGARTMKNTAELINKSGSGVYAAKNGFWSDDDCSTAVAYRKDGLQLFIILLGDTKKEREKDLLALIQYAKKSVQGIVAVKAGTHVGKVHVRHGARTSVDVYTGETGYAYLTKEGSSRLVSTKTDLYSNVKAPLVSGQRVGTYRIYVSGEQVNSVPIVVRENVLPGWLPSYLGISNFATVVILLLLLAVVAVLLWIASIRARNRRRRRLARQRKIERLARQKMMEEEERNQRGWRF